jgi:hypothetical protein
MTNLETSVQTNVHKIGQKPKWSLLDNESVQSPAAAREEPIDPLPQLTSETRAAIETTFQRPGRDSSDSMYRRFLSRNWLGA